MKILATLSLFLGVAGLLQAQVAAQATPKALQNAADQKAAAFLKNTGLIAIADTARSYSTFGNTTTVHYSTEASVTVDTVRGLVVGFRNDARLREQLQKGAGRGEYKITSEGQVRKLAEQLRKQAGIPTTYVLEGVRFFGRNDKRVADTNKEGVCSGSFAAAPNGRSFYSRGMQILFTFDPLDGELMSYHRMDNSKIESSTVTIDAAKAKSIAVKAVATRGYKVVGATNPKLAYTSPNGVFGGVSYPATAPYRLRLAYGFMLTGKSGGTVWVDAADGRILGGLVSR